jgi:hypothetical protein
MNFCEGGDHVKYTHHARLDINGKPIERLGKRHYWLTKTLCGKEVTYVTAAEIPSCPICQKKKTAGNDDA